MKPAQFNYHDPASVAEVIDLLAEHGDEAAILAGGQSLVPLLNLRLARPESVIDLRLVDELRTFRSDDSGVTVGATVTASELMNRPERRRCGAGLGEAIALIGHPQIRNRTTIGGTVAHADPASEMPAVLLALDGAVTATSKSGGDRRIAAADLFDGAYSTTRRPDELITAVHLPAFDGVSTTVEIARRPGDFALVGAFVGLADGASRVCLFGVADRPIRVPEAEAAIDAEATNADVSEAVRAAVDPRDDGHATGSYRRHVAGTIVARARTALAESSR